MFLGTPPPTQNCTYFPKTCSHYGQDAAQVLFVYVFLCRLVAQPSARKERQNKHVAERLGSRPARCSILEACQLKLYDAYSN